MTPRNKAIQELQLHNYAFKRNGGNHDIYYNAKLHCSIPLKRHDFNENDLNYILKEIRQKERMHG